MPDPTLEQRIAEAIAKVRKEMPSEAGATIEPMSFLDKAGAQLKQHMPVVGTGNPIMATTRGQRVAYNPANLEGQSNAQLEDLIAHELLHTRQNRSPAQPQPMGGFTYGQDPRELEAFGFEGDRDVRQGRTPDLQPSFTGDPVRSNDIQLPSTARVEAQKRKLLEAELLRREAAKRGN